MEKLKKGGLFFGVDVRETPGARPIPADGQTSPPKKRGVLAASPVRRASKTPSSQRRAISAAEIEREAEANADARRTFKSPHGREWTVRIHECLDREGAQQKVLRFTAGDIVVELKSWPQNWRELVVIEYAVLLLDADPPRRREGRGAAEKEGGLGHR